MSLLITPSRMLVTDVNGQPRFDTDNRHIHIVGSVTTPAFTSSAMKIYQIPLVVGPYTSTIERFFANVTATGASAQITVNRASNAAVFPFVRISGGASDTGGEFLFSPGSTVLDVYHANRGYGGAYVVSPIVSTRMVGSSLTVRCHAKAVLSISAVSYAMNGGDTTFGLYNGSAQRLEGSQLTFLNAGRLTRNPPHTFSFNPGVSVEYKILIGAY